MSAPEANRYVDLDLRVDPTLISYAITYAKQYEGEWGPMIAARELAWGTGNLPLPVARMVLNCARSDARCALDLPKPRSRTFVGPFPAMPDPEPESRPRRSRRLRLVDHEPERLPRDLASRWKLRYGRSGAKTGGNQRRVWHVLDPERSRIRYYPLAEPEHQFSALILWVCGSSSSREPVLSGDPPADLPMCKVCQKLLEAEKYAEFRPELRSWWLDEQERLTDPNKEG